MILIMAMNHYQRLFLDFSDYEASDGKINLKIVFFNFSCKSVKALKWGLDRKIKSDFMQNQELKLEYE